MGGVGPWADECPSMLGWGELDMRNGVEMDT